MKNIKVTTSPKRRNLNKKNSYTAAAMIGTVSCGFHSKLLTVPSTVKIFVHRPVMTSQKRIVLSELPENKKEYILYTNEDNKNICHLIAVKVGFI